MLKRSPQRGAVLELGSGAGFAKEVLPQIITSDINLYRRIDQVADATRMPFQNESLRAVFMINVLHHIANAQAFFQEIERCLVPEGRVLIIDQYPGIPGRWIYQYAHHEAYDANALRWEFPSSGPLSGANGALAWIIFVRDRKRFESKFPQLRIERIEPHTPLRYWLSGGLNRWSLLPSIAFPAASFLDWTLLRISKHFASFLDIELMKVK